MAKDFALIKKVESGVYSPTFTGVANVDSVSSSAEAMWLRVGDIVHVAGQVTIDPTAAAQTEVGVSFPVASRITDSAQVAGLISAVIPTMAGLVLGDVTNTRAELRFTAPDGTSRSVRYAFTYRIVY